MSLKELLTSSKPGDYKKIMDYQITPNDIEDFYDLYYHYLAIEAKYKEVSSNKKEVAEDLAKLLIILDQMGYLIRRKILMEKLYYNNLLMGFDDRREIKK